MEASQPALVDFHKGGCPTCVLPDSVMAKLAKEYDGRAVIAKFQLIKPYCAVTSETPRKKYEVYFYPTTILFVNGVATQRWEVHLGADAYRKALGAAIAGDAMEETPAATEPGGDVPVPAERAGPTGG